MTEPLSSQPPSSQPPSSQPPKGLTVPNSVAIIMDGNGRWARSRGFERVRGHERGTTAVRESVEQCAALGVEALTLYAFSEENWQRPRVEIKFLMALLKRFLVKERDDIMRRLISFAVLVCWRPLDSAFGQGFLQFVDLFLRDRRVVEMQVKKAFQFRKGCQIAYGCVVEVQVF